MRVVILDSEEKNIRYFLDYIKDRYQDWSVNAYATTFAFATAVYDDFKGDAELLLIHVEEAEHIELAQDLQECFPHLRIIFYAETTEWAEEIFRAEPSFFLQLPFRGEALEMAFGRVKTGCEEDIGRTLTIRMRGQKQKIRFSAIRYIESVGRKMFLYTDGGSFETYMTMEAALRSLPPQFVQCHRSYIVNVDRIEKYCVDEMLLTGGAQVPISRTYQKRLKEVISEKGENKCL
ncbi:MAG: LytTR family transcriptional regulator DNA-binding domain-containing protein [Roseburia sp.]|nr:LytTR family transcriptional regulator DNA-binding domain-containing protein [Roseburia sp.]MCM1096839.1 LytTR family transcriptional regulator DNA-binding domain-containing protein [Ruminococcus flavefaciens]